MTTTGEARIEVVGSEAAASVPNWALVSFDVACARCGHDLHGLSEPTCPACALEFDWADAVPIEELTCAQCGYHLYGLSETRCPECGTDFEWSEALARYYRTRMPYFEYRLRERPVRSFCGTWRLALQPMRFWHKINIHDPPQPIGLLLMVSLCVVFFAAFSVLGPALVSSCLSVHYWLHGSASGRVLFTTAQLVTFVMQDFVSALRAHATWTATLVYGTWLLMSFASLLIFQQSMRRCKVRTAQVVRVWAYAVPMVAPLLLLLGFIEVSIEELIRVGWNPSWINQNHLMMGGLLVLGGHVLWSLRCAYGRYLGMPHAWGIAISSQIVAILGMVVLVDFVFHLGVYVEIVYTIGQWMGEW